MPMTVSRTSPRTANGRRTQEINRVVVGDIDRLRRDAGMSVRRLAHEASIDAGYLSQVLAGSRSPSTAVLVALTTVLGADLSIRVYPTTGPTVRDGIQARIGEELLRMVAPTWRPSIEVPVYRPARGFIDIVFDEPTLSVTIATEMQSRMDRLEQQVRWAQDKAQSLPSSDLWRFVDNERSISRMLVLRSTGVDAGDRATLRDDHGGRLSGQDQRCLQSDHRWGNGVAGSWDPVGGRRRRQRQCPRTAAARRVTWPVMAPSHRISVQLVRSCEAGSAGAASMAQSRQAQYCEGSIRLG